MRSTHRCAVCGQEGTDNTLDNTGRFYAADGLHDDMHAEPARWPDGLLATAHGSHTEGEIMTAIRLWGFT